MHHFDAEARDFNLVCKKSEKPTGQQMMQVILTTKNIDYR